MDYKVYRLDDTGHIVSREDIEAPDDEAAIEKARQFVDGHDIELWQLGRMVTLLKRH